jgi:DNA-binding beta-propeller fold protein YncE
MNRSTDKGITVFMGKPLNNPGGFAVSPTTGDLLVTNLNDNNIVELNMTSGRVVGVRQVDNVPVNADDNNGSALFGVAAATDSKGNLVVYYTDDNLNTLNMLSAS